MDAKSAWKTEYKGSSAKLFARVLKYEQRKELAGLESHIPICQSSGMGKSRLVDEVAKEVFTIPICLSSSGGTSVPPTDTSARNEILAIMGIANKVQREVSFCIFFESLFKAVHTHAQAMINKVKRRKPSITYHELAFIWRKYIGDAESENRKAIFQQCIGLHNENSNLIAQINSIESVEEYGLRLFTAVDKLKKLIVDETLEKKSLILLSVDEVDTVTMISGNKSRMDVTNYLSIMRVLYAENMPTVMVTVLSTLGRVFDIAPTHAIISAKLKGNKHELQPIFIELPFDIHVEPIHENQLHLGGVCTSDFISRFGRAVFKAAYDNGRRDTIVEFAAAKLASGIGLGFLFDDVENPFNRLGITEFYDPMKQKTIMAILNVRFLLYSGTYRTLPPVDEQDQISSNLLTIKHIPLHRQYMHSGHPPEPLVAEASAQLLEVPQNLGRIIQVCDVLFGSYLTGSNARGDRGEFVARLLLMAAHDRTALQQEQTDSQLKYTKPLKVIDFLKGLLKDDYHNMILNLMPEIRRSDEKKLESAFANAYINFTQYIKAKDSSVCDYNIAWQAMVRSAAIQCSSTQEDVDIIIPIAFSNSNNPPILGRKSVSAIMIQVKNRDTATTVDIDMKKLNFFQDGTPDVDNKHPFIYIVMQLGQEKLKDPVKSEQKEAVNTRSYTGSEKHPQYKFVIHGVRNVYEGINEKDAINLRNLLVGKTPDDGYPRKPVTANTSSNAADTEFKEIKAIALNTINGYKIDIGHGVNLVPLE